MTTVGGSTRVGLEFLVDGVAYGGREVAMTYSRYVRGMFTADPVRVKRRLPSPRLHPVRWLNGRALVSLEACVWQMTVGSLPTFAYADMFFGALVTHGDRPAPPLVPMLGGRAEAHYGLGSCYLFTATSNRVAAELYRLLCGAVPAVVSIHHDRAPDLLGFTAADGDRQIASFSVPVTGRLKPADTSLSAYSSWDGAPVQWTLHDKGRDAMRIGSHGARLRLGDHPLAAELRSLGWSTTPLLVGVGADGVLPMDLAPPRVGPAGPPPPPAPPQPTEAPVVIVFDDGRQKTVNQMLDRLPFSAAGVFEQAPRQ